MTLWPCFVCGLETRCAHREPELMIWLREQDRYRRKVAALRVIERKPPASETELLLKEWSA